MSRGVRALQWVGLGLFAASITLTIVARTADFGPDTGDIAVWALVHELLRRGSVLYVGVWDHKDWAFFALARPFYAAWSIVGLYVLGVIATLGYATGVFMVVRGLTGGRLALPIASATALAYVSFVSYLGVYPEDYAMGLAVLAAGLSFRRPLAGGLVFALSTAVKLGGIGLFLGFMAGLLVMEARQRSSGRRGDRRLAPRLLGGFIVGCFLLVALAWRDGALGGWLDAIAYNAEYATIRRGGPFSVDDLAETLRAVWSQPSLAGTGASIALAVAALVLVWRHDHLRVASSQLGSSWVGDASQRLGASLGLVVGATGALASQQPASYQHYQYLVGPLLLTLAVVLGIGLGLPDRRMRLGAAGLAIVAWGWIVVPFWIGANGPFTGTQAGLAAWAKLDSPGSLATVSANLPAGARIAIYGTNRHRIDLRAAPADIRLACPHDYQFPWLLPRYRSTIDRCLADTPDVVFWERASYFEDPPYVAWRADTLAVLSASYIRCAAPEDAYLVFASAPGLCPG